VNICFQGCLRPGAVSEWQDEQPPRGQTPWLESFNNDYEVRVSVQKGKITAIFSSIFMKSLKACKLLLLMLLRSVTF
jgi:hypothetical protein